MIKLPDEGHLLRIFIGKSDQHEGRTLYEAIAPHARTRGVAGMTVLAASWVLAPAMPWPAMSTCPATCRLSRNRDKPERIMGLLNELDPIIEGGARSSRPGPSSIGATLLTRRGCNRRLCDPRRSTWADPRLGWGIRRRFE